MKSRTTVNAVKISYDEDTDVLTFEKKDVILHLRMGEDNLNLLYTMTPYHRYKKFLMKKQKFKCAECKKNLGVWMPILEQYGPALLKECRLANELSVELVEKWLRAYMLRKRRNGKEKAKDIAQKLSNHTLFKSHGRHIGIKEAKSLGLNISEMEKDQTLQDLVLSIFHSTTQTFDGTGAVKIIENHVGSTFIKQITRIIPVQKKPKDQKKAEEAKN